MRLLKPAEFEADQAGPILQSNPGIRFLEGTIERINYATRELAVIAGGDTWRLALAAESLLWLDGRRAVFRCFQPLDHARLFFRSSDSKLVVEALYVWTEE